MKQVTLEPLIHVAMDHHTYNKSSKIEARALESRGPRPPGYPSTILTSGSGSFFMKGVL